MKIEKAKPKDLPTIISLWEDSFPLEKPEVNRVFFQHIFHLEDTYVLKEQDEIYCMLQTRKVKIMLDKPFDVSFIVGVATPKKYQKQGYMKLMLSQVLTLLKETEAFTILQAYDWNLYIPFGFEIAYYSKKVNVDKHCYEICNPYEVKYEALSKDLLEVYQQYTKCKNGYRIRDIAYYDEYAKPYYLADGASWLCVYDAYHKLVAYAVYNEEDVLHVVEFMYRNEESKKAILHSLCSLKKEIYITCSVEDEIEGTYERIPVMMMKKHRDIEYREPLFINEVL